MLSLRELTHFLTLAQTLHFGRAAEQLGLTQPPLSQSILALETKLGAPLFHRSKRSVELTPFGAQWLLHVRPAVEAVQALSETARRIRQGLQGRLSLAFVSTADYSLLPDLVRHYCADFPDVELELIEATNDYQIQALQTGRIDAGILIAPHASLPPSLDYFPLLREPLIAAVPQAWLESETALDMRNGQLQGHDWMQRPLLMFPHRVSPDFHDLVSDFYHRHGYQPQIRQEAIQMQTLISLVSAGLGMALVPASLQKLARPGVRYVPLAIEAPQLETGLAWRQNQDQQSPTLASLIQIASKL